MSKFAWLGCDRSETEGALNHRGQRDAVRDDEVRDGVRTETDRGFGGYAERWPCRTGFFQTSDRFRPGRSPKVTILRSV